MLRPLTTYQISFKQLIWLFFIVFFIHNLEELVTVNFWLKENLHLLPILLRTTISKYIFYDLHTFYLIAILIATLLPLIFCIWANNTSNFKITSILMMTLSWILLLNALQHVSNTLVLGKYSPGFISALAINIPFSIYMGYRLNNENISKKKLFLFMPIGLLVYILSLIIIFLISYEILIHIKK